MPSSNPSEIDLAFHTFAFDILYTSCVLRSIQLTGLLLLFYPLYVHSLFRNVVLKITYQLILSMFLFSFTPFILTFYPYLTFTIPFRSKLSNYRIDKLYIFRCMTIIWGCSVTRELQLWSACLEVAYKLGRIFF